MFTGSNPVYQALVERASSRIKTAYRPKTVRTHKSHFTLLLQFLQCLPPGHQTPRDLVFGCSLVIHCCQSPSTRFRGFLLPTTFTSITTLPTILLPYLVFGPQYNAVVLPTTTYLTLTTSWVHIFFKFFYFYKTIYTSLIN